MKQISCPICQGTGFYQGQICSCITGKKTGNVPEIPDVLKDIFGDIFNGTKKGPNG